MIVKVLSFAIVYFFQSSLFNGLQPIQTKKCGRRLSLDQICLTQRSALRQGPGIGQVRSCFVFRHQEIYNIDFCTREDGARNKSGGSDPRSACPQCRSGSVVRSPFRANAGVLFRMRAHNSRAWRSFLALCDRSLRAAVDPRDHSPGDGVHQPHGPPDDRAPRNRRRRGKARNSLAGCSKTDSRPIAYTIADQVMR